MKSLFKKGEYLFAAVVVWVAFGAAVSFAGPTVLPPNGNPVKPLYISDASGAQVKQGSLAVNAGNPGAPVGLAVSEKMSVGLGTIPANVSMGVAGVVGADSFCDSTGTKCFTIPQIKAGQVSDIIPSGAVFMFETNTNGKECPVGFSNYNALRGKFLRFAATQESAGGQAGDIYHSHTVVGGGNEKLVGPYEPQTRYNYSSGSIGAPKAPTGVSSLADVTLPPFYDVYFCRKN